jgi:exonuclease SbcD
LPFNIFPKCQSAVLEDQAYILDMFVEKMKEEEPDIIVIAGDLYDTTYPSKE